MGSRSSASSGGTKAADGFRPESSAARPRTMGDSRGMSDADVDSLAKEVLDLCVGWNPIFATYVGIYEHDYRLPNGTFDSCGAPVFSSAVPISVARTIAAGRLELPIPIQRPRLPLPVLFAAGIGIYLVELAKPFAPSLFSVLTAVQVILAVLAIRLASVYILPLKFARPQRERIDGEFYECRSVPVLALMVILATALVFLAVALFVLNSSDTEQRKGNVVLFSLVLIFPLVAAAGLLSNRIIFARGRICFWGRLFTQEFLSCIPTAKIDIWAAVGPIVFPAKYRYLPVMWHIVSDPHSVVAASMRVLQGLSRDLTT